MSKLDLPKGRLIRPAKPTVCVGLTAYRVVEQKTVQSLFNAMGQLPYEFGLITHTSANVWKGRNAIVEQFLKGPGDYLVFIDADMEFTPDDLNKLIRAAIETDDAGLIGGFYTSRDENMRPLISWRSEDDGRQEPTALLIPKLLAARGKLVEADLIPTGFMLIKRHVFEDVKEPWFIVKTIEHEDGTIQDLSSDNVFVEKVQKAGYKTYGHFGIELGHVGTYVYHPAQMWPQLEAYSGMIELNTAKLKFGAEFGWNTKEYWDALYKKEAKLGRERIYPTLHAVVLAGMQDEWKVVDVGSGTGVLAKQISEAASSCDCLDLSDYAVAQCKAQGLNAAQFNICTDDPSPYADAYDAVVCTEVMEHLEDDVLQSSFNKLVAMAKVGGVIIVTVPDNRLTPEEEPEHNQVFTAAKFAKLFKGLDEIFIEPIEGYLVGAAKKPNKEAK